MDIKKIADGDLWQARLKIMMWGEDIEGKPTGEDEILQIQEEMMARGLVNDQSVNDFGIGTEYLQAGNYEQAASCFRKAIEISPKFLDAYTNLGGCLIDMGQLEHAREVLEKGREIGITIDLTNNLDRVYNLLGDDK